MSQMTAMHIPDGASAPPDGQPLNGGAYQVQLQATADGKLLVSGISGGGGGSGDASAVNQVTQITLETEIRDRLPTALGTQAAATSLSVTVATDQAALATKIGRFKASAAFNRPADTTAYAIGDAVTNSTSAPTALQLTVGATNGQAYVITEAVVISSAKGATLPLFTLYLFPTTFTATNDNVALAIDQTTYESGGAIIPLTEQSSVSARARVGASGLNIVRALAAGDTKLYATLQAANAYTPASGETLTVVLYGYLL